MLRTRLYLGLLPLLLLFTVVGLAAMLLCRDLAQSVEKKLLSGYRLMIGCYEMREAAGRMTYYIHEAQNGRVFEARDPYAEQRGRFQKVLMEQSFVSGGTSRATEVEAVADAFDRLNAQAEVALGSQHGSRLREDYAAAELAFFQTLKALDDITQRDYNDLRSEAGRVAGLARTSIKILAAALVGGILLSLFLSYRLSRSLLQPIKQLTQSAAALGDGQLDRDVPVTSEDELGELARTFNTMAAKLRAYREATTEKVVRAQRTMEATLTSTPDPLFVVSRDGKPELRNPAAEILAATPEFAEGFPEKLQRRLQEVLTTGVHYLPTDYEQVVAVRVDRDERHFLPRILAIGDALTGFGGAAMILQDVTKFRLLDDAKSNLVGTVSHELKTPLTSLRMAIYLLLEQKIGPLQPAQVDLLESARDDADRLLRILNDLLDLARLESGVATLNRREVQISILLEDMAREMKGIVEAAEQRIEIKIAPGFGTIRVDPERIRHVFINLLANASKYSGVGNSITLYAESAANDCVRFGVRDRGPGISEESVHRVFEKFYRVPGQTKKGAGLGLTIAREIVLAHGGTIACSSKLGDGCDFYFLIPIDRTPALSA